MLHDKDNSQAFNNSNCPEFDTCFDLKIALSEAEIEAQKVEIADGSLALSYNGSPDEHFTTEAELLNKYKNGVEVLATGNEGYQRPKLVDTPQGVKDAYIYNRATKSWQNMGNWVDYDNSIKILATTDADIFTNEVISLVVDYIKDNYSSIQDYKKLVLIKKYKDNEEIYEGYIKAVTEGGANEFEFRINGGFGKSHTDKIYFGNVVEGVLGTNTLVETTEDEKTKYDNYRNEIDNINAHKDFQDKRLDNHNDRLNDIEDIIHETVITEVEEKFVGNKFNVPTSVEVEGRNFGVIDNQYFKISGIKGQSKNSENIITFPYIESRPMPLNGLTFVVNPNGSIKINGKATKNTLYYLMQPLAGEVKLNGDYVLSGIKNNPNNDVFISLETNNGIGLNCYSSPQVYYNLKNDSVNFAYIYIPEGSTLTNFIVEPMFNKGRIAKPFNKGYKGIQPTTIKSITSIGANRILFPYADKDRPNPINGVNFEIKEDGSILINGTATGNIVYYLMDVVENRFPLNGKYMLYGIEDNVENKYFLSMETHNGVGYNSYNIPTYYNVTNDSIKNAYIYIPSGTTMNNVLIKPMLVKEYKKYPFSKYQIDSTIELTEGQLTLNGTTSANDEAILTKTNGTELFEVDIVKRTEEYVFTGSEDFSFEVGAGYTYVTPTFLSTEAKPDQILVSDLQYPFSIAKIGASGNMVIEFTIGTFNSQKEIQDALKGKKIIYELKKEIITKVKDNLSLGEVSVIGQKGGEFQVNPIEPNVVEPKETRMKFDIKYWEEPTGGK